MVFRQKTPLLFRRGVFVAEQAVRGFVLLYYWESSHILVEAVVAVVVIDLGNLPNQHLAASFLCPKGVVEPERKSYTMYGTLGPERVVWDEEAKEAMRKAVQKQKKK